MMAVPSMLIVAPKGMVNVVVSLIYPHTHAFCNAVTGMAVALGAEVQKQKSNCTPFSSSERSMDSA
jgi:hypothetical protein